MQAISDWRRFLVPFAFFDDRGSLTVIEHGALPAFSQQLISRNDAYVLRGLHMQTSKPQGKFVTVVEGFIYDVCVDTRPGNVGAWEAVYLRDGESAYCPPETLHGFVALEKSIVVYSCTELFDPESDGGCLWESVPQLPRIPGSKRSEKDQKLPGFDEFISTLRVQRQRAAV